MEYYFRLQLSRFNRKIRELGLPPLAFLIISSILFFGLSHYLFYKTVYANWIYGTCAIIALSSIAERLRIENLKSIFNQIEFYKIRLSENLLLSTPFICYLVYQHEWIIALVILIATILMSILSNYISISRTIPTPFKKFPFEFITGFRKFFWVYLIAYFICIKSIQVQNPKLGLFSLSLIFLISMTFYATPEKINFVWIFKSNTKNFLMDKILTSLICSTILSTPLFLVLSYYYPTQFIYIIGVQCLGYVFLSSMVLAKYSAYPNEMSVPQAILYGLSLWFPPMLLVIIPIFYLQSKKRLRSILE